MSEALTVPDGVDPLDHRAKMTGEYAERTFDMMVSSWACAACRKPVPPPPPLVIPFANYRSLGQLTETVQRSADAAVAGGAGHDPCPACHGQATLAAADYFAFSSALAADLVVRHAPGRAIELLKWSRAAGFTPQPSTPEIERAVGRDALIRSILAKKDEGEDAAGFALIKEAVASMPGEPTLLKFLPWVNRVGDLELSRAVAAAHVAARPDDADGRYWLAQATVEAVAKGLKPRAAIAEAVPELERAVAIRADYPDALIALANVSRIRGKDDDAERALRALVASHPDHAEGNYTLGLVLLAKHPAEALTCFERGEKSAPTDADYPRSRARALVALKRPDEARAAIARAKQLAPDDPRIDQVAAEITTGTQRGMSGAIKGVVYLVLVGVFATVAWVAYGAIAGAKAPAHTPAPAKAAEPHHPGKRH
jgi:tetratricopeptide (TPR) repeat protein